MDYRPRSSWENPSQPINGPAPKQVAWRPVAHYTAATNSLNPANAAQDLRNMQNSYLSARGFSLGYWAYVDQNGVAWQIRGPHPAETKHYNPAANLGRLVGYPPTNGNDGSAPILFGHGTNYAISDAAINTAVELWRYWGLTGRPLAHSEMDPTGCCGDQARAQLAAGLLDINPNPNPPGDTTMQSFMWTHRDQIGLFWISDGSAVHIDKEIKDRLLAQGVELITSDNLEVHNSLARVTRLWS